MFLRCPTSLLSSRPCRLASAVVASLLPMAAMAAPNVEFNPQFLQGTQAGALDLTRFERGDALPGTYSADIRVNGTVVARREVELRALHDGSLALCFTPALVQVLGLELARVPAAGQVSDVDGLAEEVRPMPDTVFCDPLSLYIPQAAARFDVGEQVLDIDIPQAYLARDPRGWVPQELWDDGITAALVGYSVSHQRIQNRGYDSQSTSVMLNAGLNVGAWRLRHDGFLSQGSGPRTGYRAGRSYAERSIAALGVELTAGEASTRGDVFDGVSFRGLSISTDPRMLPDSLRDYAPVVRGVAQSNARVVIRQRDRVLYQANVAAGPFEINDLYGTAYAGDLDVEITENDGRVQRFVVPFASVPQLLRAGQQRFSLTVGVLQDMALRDRPRLLEATLRKGLSNRVTGFTGATASDGYQAVLLGAALNTAAGAFSGDVTFARADLRGALADAAGRMSGQSFRLAYSKDIAASGTNFSMAAYRYSTAGYVSLADAARLRQYVDERREWTPPAQQRARLDLNLNQRLGERSGLLYVSASSVDYWDQRQRRSAFSVGYSDRLGPATYSIALQRSTERSLGGGTGREGNSINFNMSIPLGARTSAPRMTLAANRRNSGRDDARAGINGNFGDRNQGSYNVTASQYRGQGSSYDTGVNYQTSVASLSAGYTHSAGSDGLSLGATGGVIVHGDGVTFSQQLGDTVALVHVPDAADIALDSTVGVRTNADGYAVVPYMTPFRRNEVTIDPKGLSMDVELKTASVIGVPTAGAVVRLVIPTSSGRSALIEAPRADGQPLPFGLDVYNEAGEVVGVVGQASRLWVRGIEPSGRLTVRWGAKPGEQCVIAYALQEAQPADLIAAQCVDPDAG